MSQHKSTVRMIVGRVFLLRELFAWSLFASITAVSSAAERDQRTEIPAAAKHTVSFAKEVRPLLAARCGTCHMNGKKNGGFRMDSRTLFLDGGDSGPAVVLGKSGESLLIRLVAALNPDERMPPQGPVLSNEHVGILRAWIDQGLKWEETIATAKKSEELTAAGAEAAGLCPVQKVPSKLVYHATIGEQTYHFCCLQCKKAFVANPAQYSAEVSPVTTDKHAALPLAVAPAKLTAQALAQVIDRHIDQHLVEKKIPRSPLSDDAEFLRRVYLDLHGVIPPTEKVVAFLDSRDVHKRETIIDALLADAQYGRHMADVWDHLLVARDTPGCEPAVVPLTGYLERKFNANVGWDALIREILTSSGTQQENGAVTYFLANRTTPMVMDSISRVFPALPLECAQCHDHPYTRWEQHDYWGMAAFFNGLGRGAVDKYGVIHPESTRGLTEPLSRLQASLPVPAGKRLEKDDRFQARFLGEAPIALKRDEEVLSRPLAAKWLTAPENPYFARAMVNRTWWHFFGRGLVNPVDDMFKPGVTATHPELLEELSRQFVASGFDVKHLVRAMVSSQAYQRSSKPLKENEVDKEFYSHRALRVQTPEQLWDSLVQMFGSEPQMPPAKKTIIHQVLRDGMPTTPRGEFIKYFLGESNAAPTEYTQGIPHILRLLNGVQFNNVDDALKRIVPDHTEPDRAVESLYLAILSRRPAPEETAYLIEYVQRHGNRQTALADILWALLKSSEFVMNH